jgi:hypothetical protein
MEVRMPQRVLSDELQEALKARFERAAARTVAQTIRAGAGCYDRARDLPRLARIDGTEPLADTADGVAAIVARLERALRAERNRARSGHWTYDLNRHIALSQAHRAESQRLAALRKAAAAGGA